MVDLDVVHGVLRYSHIGVALIGLAVFWVPVFAVKGSRLHNSCGTVFAWTAYYAGVTALASSLWALLHPASFIGAKWGQMSSEEQANLVANLQFIFMILGFLALAVLNSITFGLRVLRTRREHRLLQNPLLMSLQGALGLWSFALAAFGIWNIVLCWTGQHPSGAGALGQYVIPTALGVFGLYSLWSDLNYILKPRPTRMAWWYKHMENMLGCGIAFHTAFLVFGANRLFDLSLSGAWQLVPWILPTAVGLPLISAWTRYYQKKFGEIAPPQQQVQPPVNAGPLSS